MKITKSELKEMIREALREELSKVKRPLKEAVSSMYIVAAGGPGGGEVYYIGRIRARAQFKYNAVTEDWLEFGLGGGDTNIYFYKYFGPAEVFEDTLATWEAGGNTSYGETIEELGFDLKDCEVLAVSEPAEVDCWKCGGSVIVAEGVSETKCPNCGTILLMHWDD